MNERLGLLIDNPASEGGLRCAFDEFGGQAIKESRTERQVVLSPGRGMFIASTSRTRALCWWPLNGP